MKAETIVGGPALLNLPRGSHAKQPARSERVVLAGILDRHPA